MKKVETSQGASGFYKMVLSDATESTKGAFVFNKQEILKDQADGLVKRIWKRPTCYPPIPAVRGQNFKLDYIV